MARTHRKSPVSRSARGFSGVTQSISVSAASGFAAKSVFVRSQEKLTDPNDGVWMKIEFYNHWADYFGGGDGSRSGRSPMAATPTDAWR